MFPHLGNARGGCIGLAGDFSDVPLFSQDTQTSQSLGHASGLECGLRGLEWARFQLPLRWTLLRAEGGQVRKTTTPSARPPTPSPRHGPLPNVGICQPAKSRLMQGASLNQDGGGPRDTVASQRPRIEKDGDRAMIPQVRPAGLQLPAALPLLPAHPVGPQRPGASGKQGAAAPQDHGLPGKGPEKLTRQSDPLM